MWKAAPVVLVLGLAVASACDGESDMSEPSPTPEVTPATTSEPTFAATSEPALEPTLEPTAELTPEPSPSPSGGDLPPGQVTGLEADAGGGSAEIQLIWNTSPEPGVDHYNVYRSTTSGGPYQFVASVPNQQVAWLPDGKVGFVDLDRSGTLCYVVTAVDVPGNEGPIAAEACGAPPHAHRGGASTDLTQACLLARPSVAGHLLQGPFSCSPRTKG